MAQSTLKTDSPGKVLFVTPGLNLGGSEMFLLNLLNHFHREPGEIILVSLSGSGYLEKRLDPSISLRNMPRRWRYDLSPAARIASLIKRNDIATVFALDLYSFFYVRLALMIAARRPRVFVSLHSTKRRTVYEQIQWLIYTRLLRKDDVLLGISRNQVSYLSGKYGIPLERFMVIYNGVDQDHWTLPPAGFDRKEARAGLGLGETADVIVQVAGFRREKRHEDSLRALAIVHGESDLTPHLLLVGAGSTETEERLRGKSAEYGLSSHVRFCGQQSDVRPFYWVSDLFTLSSNTETFSIAALEAMSTGLPCVLTDVGGAREMVIDGTNGYTVSPENPRLLADAWMRVLGRKADFSPGIIRETIASRFSLARCVQSYEKLLFES